MQKQKTAGAASAAAGASGGARQQKSPREWYTIVVYEKPRYKTVVFYLGKWQTFRFKVPASINVGNIAVIIRRWRVSDKTVACSASIHVANLAKLLQEYAREEAEKAGILEPILREAEELSEVIAHADGAQPEAVVVPKTKVCSKVTELIHDMRSDLYLAVRIDELVKTVNDVLRLEAEERGQEAEEYGEEDVKRCLKYDDTVRVIGDRSGEAVWLWGGSYMFLLADKAAKMALRYGAALMEAEEYGEEDVGNAAAAL